jgi:hypothetical protein
MPNRNLITPLLGLLFAPLILSLSACHFHRSFINDKGDIDEGRIFLNQFYNDVRLKDTTALSRLPSDSLKKLMHQKHVSLGTITSFVNLRFGNYHDYTVDTVYTNRTEGSINNTVYKYKLHVVYERGDLEELVGFVKNGSAGPLLNFYYVTPVNQ